MKALWNILLIILLFYVKTAHCYIILNEWLDYRSSENSYKVYIDPAFNDSINNRLGQAPVSLNVANCISAWQNTAVDNLPAMEYDGVSGSLSPVIKYSNTYITRSGVELSFQQDMYGYTRLPLLSEGRIYDDFTIYINGNNVVRYYPWNSEGGACEEWIFNYDTQELEFVKTGGVDLNTILKHELGHIYSFSHYDNELTLMSSGTKMAEPDDEGNCWQPLTVDTLEINGLKAQYTPPSLHILNSQDNVIKIGDSITFEIECPVDTKIDSVFSGNFNADSLFHCYLKYPYDLYPDSVGYHIAQISGYEMQVEVPDTTVWVSTETYIARSRFTFIPDSIGTYKFKVYTAMDWNESGNLDIYEYYPDRIRPYSEVEFRVTPIVDLTKVDIFKSDYYSMDSIHVFEATCTDANWNDYPYMESMKFYFKREGETSYTEIPAPPVKTTYYTRTWDSKAYTGEVLIKATASYYSDASYSELYETSDSITVQIFDRETCVITSPKPAEEESWDFEFAPYIYRGYYSDHSLESEAVFKTTLKDVKNDDMIFNGDYWSGFYFDLMTCPETKYHWSYLGYEWQWAYYVTLGHTGEINGLEGWHNTYPFWDTLGPTKTAKTGICKKALYFDHKREPQPDTESDDGTDSKLVSYYDMGYKAYYEDHEHLYPGIYNAAYHAYDINDGVTDIADSASVDFLIPEWKLKLLNESKWFDYSYSSTTGPTYVERTEYHEGDIIHSMVWHPYEYYNKNTINYKITNSDTEAIIFEKDLTGTDYLTDTFITNNYAPEDTLAYYHHIWDTSGLTPGFYKIKTEGMSIIDSINVSQEREIQICPYFEQWENGGAWSEDWPAPVGSDTLYWKIKDLGYNYYAANQYMLEAHYETGFHLNSTTTDEEYTVNNTYPAMLEICIAPRQKWNRDGDFWYWEDQLSNFTVELSKDGDNYVKVKTLDLQLDGYIDYPWNLPANPEQSNPYDTEDSQYYMICAMNFYFPIGEVTGSGNSLKIRLGIEGIPSYFTDDISDNQISHIYVDEIKLWYMKGRENRPVPRNLAVSQAKESNTVTLTFDPPAVTGSEYPEKYKIYREGKLMYETTGTSFTDTEITGSTEYNYIVVADYPGYDYHESSMLDCSMHYETDPITYARPSFFSISKGIGLLDNCVTLEWLEPASGVSYYEIYRNSVLMGTTTELSYHDNLLPDGAYEYYVKARYGDEPYEVSDATDIKSVSIYSTVLPIYEDFEHDGELPLCWYHDVTIHNNDNLWASELTTVNGISPYEGSYCSYVRGRSAYDCLCYASSGLRTPDIDLSSYSNLNLSYMVNLSQDRYDNDMNTVLYAYLFDNSEIDSVFCAIDFVRYYHPKQHYLTSTTITRETNGDWQSVSVPVNYNFESCYLLFRAANYIQGDTTYIAPEDAAVMLDVVSLTGTIDLGTPENITIVRDSTNTTLSWDFVPGATEYKVYVSEDPYGTFTLDTTGTWISDTEWQKADAGDKYFYYIVAASATKEIIGDNLKIRLKSEKLKH